MRRKKHLRRDQLAAMIGMAALCLVLLVGLLILRSRRLPAAVPAAATVSAEAQTTKKHRRGKAEPAETCAALSAALGVSITQEMFAALPPETQAALEDDPAPTADRFKALTQYSPNAFVDKFGGGKSKDMGFNGRQDFTLGFTGDINFTEGDYVMPHADDLPNGVLDCIDDTFRREMAAVDIMLINNEFPYTDRGSPTPGKRYTFRAKPKRVQALLDLGVDVVSLANNHTYDYGAVSFEDTITTLNNANLPFVGAGQNFAEASAPTTFLINGYKVGFLACSSVESPIQTPVAGENSPGIMGAYDSGEAMAAAIRRAKETCDYVIAYPHWGIERTTVLTDAQLTNGKKYIDAGACAVIGNHPHVLQGMEIYRGCPIAYSLGNFWFNALTQPTGMIRLRISADGVETVFIPGRQIHSEVHYMKDAADRRVLYDDIVSWSPAPLRIDDDGVVTAG